MNMRNTLIASILLTLTLGASWAEEVEEYLSSGQVHDRCLLKIPGCEIIGNSSDTAGKCLQPCGTGPTTCPEGFKEIVKTYQHGCLCARQTGFSSDETTVIDNCIREYYVQTCETCRNRPCVDDCQWASVRFDFKGNCKRGGQNYCFALTHTVTMHLGPDAISGLTDTLFAGLG